MRCLFVDPGALRHELSLQARPGDEPGEWTEIARVFARIEPVSDASRFAADRPLEMLTHRITLRWRTGVEAGMRFVKAGRLFDILTVIDPDERQRYLICRTREERP